MHAFTGPVAREQGEVAAADRPRRLGGQALYFEFAAADAQRAGEFQNLAREHGLTPAAMMTRAGHYGHDIAGTLFGSRAGLTSSSPTR